MATTAPTVSRTAVPFGGDRIILHGVPWETYERLLTDYADRQAPRFAYNQGTLEIVVTLSGKHEETKRTLELLIDLIAAALRINRRSVGGMTLRRADVRQGFEPDSGFYLQNAPLVRDRDELDPAVDPPPDLILEVDVTSESLSKFPLFAGFGIPEIWRYDEERVTIFVLRAGTYEESPASQMLPGVTVEAINGWLAVSRTLPYPDWLLAVLSWAQPLGEAARPTPSP